MAELKKLLDLVNRITCKGNGNRARHLIRVLYRAIHENEEQGRELIQSLKESGNDVLKGMAGTLEYLLSAEEKKENLDLTLNMLDGVFMKN